MSGARGLLINITGGDDMTLFEVDQAANRIREEVDEDANIIFGSAIDDTLQGKIRVSVVATGIDSPATARAAPAPGRGRRRSGARRYADPHSGRRRNDSHGHACAGERNGGRAAPRSRAGDAACPPRAGAGSGPWSRATCRAIHVPGGQSAPMQPVMATQTVARAPAAHSAASRTGRSRRPVRRADPRGSRSPAGPCGSRTPAKPVPICDADACATRLAGTGARPRCGSARGWPVEASVQEHRPEPARASVRQAAGKRWGWTFPPSCAANPPEQALLHPSCLAPVNPTCADVTAHVRPEGAHDCPEGAGLWSDFLPSCARFRSSLSTPGSSAGE